MSETFFDQFLLGTLLGDSYITNDGRFGFGHSEVQRAYFQHKVEILTAEGLAPKVREYQTKGNQCGDYFIKSITALQARVAIKNRYPHLRQLWYPEGKKIVPPDIELGPIALAYWYMDDGSVNKRTKFTDNRPGRQSREGGPWVNQFRLHLDGFDQCSQDILQQKLLKLEIESWFYTKKKTGSRNLLITRDASKARFKELVFPYMEKVPSMMYKIDLETSFKL
jgi:hypothetical protein